MTKEACGPLLDRVTYVAWAVAAFLAPMNGVRLFSAMTYADLFVVLAATLMALSWITTGRVRIGTPNRTLVGGLMLITFAGAIGTIFAAHPATSLVQLAKFTLGSIGTVTLLALWKPDQRRVRTLASLWVVGAVVSTAWAFVGSAEFVDRPLGLTTHPNHLGLTCVLGAGMALGLALSARSVALGSVSAAASLACAAGVVVSGSRSALLGLVAVLTAMMLMSDRRRLLVFATIGALLLVALLASLGRLPEETSLKRVFGGDTSTQSDSGHRALFAVSFDRFKKHPFTGEGFEFSKEGHNIYLQMLVVGGPLALLGLGVVATTVVRTRRRGPLGTSGEEVSILLAGCVAAYIGYLVMAVFQNILWDRYLWLVVAITMGLSPLTPPPAGGSEAPALEKQAG